MNLILFHLICICNVVVFIVYSVNVETLLLKDILDNRDYNKYMRTPTVNKSEPIQVEIEIALNTIHSLDMKNQILTTSFGIKMSWTDEFLTWNKSDYGETNAITAPISKIWTPDVLLTNYADKSNIFEDNDKRVYIYSNGLVERRDDIEVKTYCVVNPTRYPFETETCTLNFRAQNLDNKEQMLSIGLPANFLNLFKSNGEWHISKPDKIRHYTTIEHVNGRNFSVVILHIEMDRRQTYYVWRFLAPTVAITFINIVTFWLPVESGAKVTLSTFVILGFTAMIELFNESLPSTSDKPSYFGRLLWWLLGISGIILILNVIIIAIFYRKCGICARLCSICNSKKKGDNKNADQEKINLQKITICSSGICSPCCSENEDDIGITELKYVKSQEESIHHQGSNPENVCFSGIEEDRQETELKYVQSQENPTNQPGTSQEHVDDIVILIEDKKNRKKEDNLDETKKNEIKKKRRKQKASKYDKICYVLMLLAYGSVYTFFCYKLFVERENENVA
ncbi:neuronal acetylcholine receptor subunit beta-4-like isoform X1 [Mytilus californianus]|uniref:neuronal acetylcholine receptor subunit beta-4-like isoform X1 n=1 Tax=Mytilus californianus TaxID=6549 RepID=UPI002245C1B2|nr:neuronal acetylcholine receptor subunit beta-4-like isoform X1 [Mytilus californianus]XP_052078204.1 neuronal acetylcholine receptor subunit beta-4-like isoform X1 [Mytilus californianus]